MSKGFSKLEMAAILFCTGIAVHGADQHTSVNFASIASQVKYIHSERGTFDAAGYLTQASNGLASINR